MPIFEVTLTRKVTIRVKAESRGRLRPALDGICFDDYDDDADDDRIEIEEADDGDDFDKVLVDGNLIDPDEASNDDIDKADGFGLEGDEEPFLPGPILASLSR